MISYNEEASGSTNKKELPPSTQWKVDRIELAFFHACENRWELFQTNANANGWNSLYDREHPQKFFKRQIGQLLNTIREAMQRAFQGTFEFFDEKDDRQICLDFTSLKNESEPALRNFCTFCRYQIESDRPGGSNSSAPEDDSELNRLLNCIETSEEYKALLSECRAEISTLVASLPIAHDWDIFGKLKPMSTDENTLKPTSFWNQSFVYRVTRSEADAKTKQQNSEREYPIPEYDYQLQICGNIDFLKRQEVPISDVLEVIDVMIGTNFYKYCKPSGKQGEVKIDLYRIYGKVLDEIQEKCFNSSCEEVEANTIYYCVIPIVACGYCHFVQIVLKKEKDGIDPSISLNELYGTFNRVLNKRGSFALKRLMLKESARELLVQIRISAFQTYVNKWIRDHKKEIDTATSHELVFLINKCFCSYCPYLNEIRAIYWNDTVWYHFAEQTGIDVQLRSDNQPSDQSPALSQGWSSREGSIEAMPEINELFKGGRYIISKLDSFNEPQGKAQPEMELCLTMKTKDPFTNLCFERTNMMRLKDQYDWLVNRMSWQWNFQQALTHIQQASIKI